MARTTNAAVVTGGSVNQDVTLGATEWLSVIGVVGTAASAAGAAGDVSVQVFPYLDDAVGVNGTPTLSPLPLPTADTSAAVLSASRAWIFARFRVAGIRKVQIQVKNNNAATKPAEIDYDLG